jgi:hypothetical protein
MFVRFKVFSCRRDRTSPVTLKTKRFEIVQPRFTIANEVKTLVPNLTHPVCQQKQWIQNAKLLITSCRLPAVGTINIYKYSDDIFLLSKSLLIPIFD